MGYSASGNGIIFFKDGITENDIKEKIKNYDLNEIEIDPKRRGETLSLEDFAKLSERIKDVI